MSHSRQLPLACALLLCTASLCACVDFAPPYQRPPAPVAAAWPARSTAAAGGRSDPADIGWAGFVQDDRLRQVVALAMDNNRDLRVALLRVQDARAQYRIQDAPRLPALSLGAGVTRSSTSGVASGSASVDLGLAAYEVDLFSRVRNASDAALNRYFATAEGARAARIAIVAAVASAWLTLRADADNEHLNLETLALDAESLALNRRLHDLGAISGLPVAQAEAAWQAAREAVAASHATLQQDRDALVLLAGAEVPERWLPLAGTPGEPAVLVDVPSGLPASVLQQRPDVLAAEHELQATQLEIGIARAAYFPAISLSASTGLASTGPAGLLRRSAGSWSVGPFLSLPLVDGGALDAGLDSARSRRGIALAAYEKALQVSFAEVADALAVRSTLAERLDAQAAQRLASEAAWRHADALYRHGATSYLQVLDAQRSLQASRQAGIALNLIEQQNRVALYKALGGGWKESN